MTDRSKHLRGGRGPQRRVTRPIAPGVRSEAGDLLTEIQKLPEETQELIRRGIQEGIRIMIGREAFMESTFTAILYSSLPPDMIPDREADENGKHYNGFMHVPRAACESAKLFTSVVSPQADGSFLVGIVPRGHEKAVLASLKKTIAEGGAEEFLATMEKPDDGETLQ
jgi:hypothetical protein